VSANPTDRQRLAAILDEEEVVLAVTRDGVPGVLALVEQREAHAKRLGAAGVCGAVANLLRDTKPTAREYDGIRVAYGAALDAAGLTDRGEHAEDARPPDEPERETTP
jgi:hypothetical protein